MSALTTRTLPVLAYFFLTLFMVPEISLSQTSYPQTLKVPVTFYDFHSDSSNPEFEVNPPSDQVHTGMVAPTLDSEKKPVLGPTPFYNHMIARWFRPWTPGNTQIYNYRSEHEEGRRYIQYVDLPAGLTNADNDTAFKNIVIHDTLTFHFVSGSKGMYEFSSNDFFPLDNKAGTFGHESNPHNYSFTMEMHWSFTMVPGLRFDFTGDDDVWAFVNNNLVMDIGGIHNPANGSFNVDNLAGLTPNQQVSFDLFYAERHTTGSNIKITTNIIAPPSVLQIFNNPNPPGDNNPPVSKIDSIIAGSSATVFGHVFDTLGAWQKEYDELIEWRIEGASSVSLSSNKGVSTTIITDKTTPTLQVTLIATFKKPGETSLPPTEVRITATVKGDEPVTPPIDPPVDPPVEPPVTPPVNPPVEPPKPVEDHLDIVLDSAAAHNAEASVPSFSFAPETKTKQVFVVVRDKNGGFIRFANDADWKSLDIQTTSVSPAHGYSTRLSAINAVVGSQTKIIATDHNLKPDSLLIIVLGKEQSGVIRNPLVPGKTDITTIAGIQNSYPNVIKAAGTNYITMVIVEAPEPLTVIHPHSSNALFNSYADVQIYDAVGNLLRDDCTLIAGEKKLTYAVSWDGTNHNGRVVGSGVYLVVIKAVRLSGQNYTLHHKVGVKTQR